MSKIQQHLAMKIGSSPSKKPIEHAEVEIEIADDDGENQLGTYRAESKEDDSITDDIAMPSARIEHKGVDGSLDFKSIDQEQIVAQ